MDRREPRLSASALKVVRFLMTSGEPQSGADITQVTKVGPGTLYPLLKRFEDAGWLTSEWEKIDPSEAKRPRKRFYSVTALGATRFRAALAEVQMFDVPEGAWAH